MIDLEAIPFRQARWYTRLGEERFIDYVVLHTMEFWRRSDAAEWCQGFFATSDRKGSTHVAVDDDSICRSVRDKDVCWGANGVNHNGLHIEHAGWAAGTPEEWADEFSSRMLRLSAELTATWCARYEIPPVFVDAAGLRRRERGITTHAEAEQAFPFGGHSDPGANFPVEKYLEMVRFFLSGDTAGDLQMAASLTIHQSELRSAFVGGEMILDFTYLPADGTTAKDSQCMSYLCVRSVNLGQEQEADVYFNGTPQKVTIPADGRTVSLPVPTAGLVSVVGRALVANARELWV